jgi:hypothetical protein
MKKVFSIIAIIFLVGLGLGTSQSMPQSQLIFLDEKTHEYYAPPCLMDSGYESKQALQAFANEHNLILLTEKARRAMPIKSHPNNECRETSAFSEPGRSVTGSFFEWMNILPKENSRWNEDGTWNKI